MTKRRLVDTNLIIRYLVRDQTQHAEIPDRFFESCDRGEIIAVLLLPVLAESVHVLESFYARPRASIATTLTGFISSRGVSVDDLTVCLDAFDRYSRTKIHFTDCILAATAAAENTPIASFDQDFSRFKDVEVRLD